MPKICKSVELKREIRKLKANYIFTLRCLNQFNTIECAPGKRGKKNMKFSTEYIYFHQTYINIQCVVQRANIETVKTKFTKIHYHS